ncbi:MAG: tetratricopeptide repeat protein [Alphaproteobacteria bacterium]|nr:tetratricopeptide repeat protein [Alphaproteobacteria bacterium]
MQQKQISIPEALKLAKKLLANNQIGKAAQILGEVTQRQPSLVEAQQLYATALMQIDRAEDAEPALRRALNAAPDHVGLLNTLGLCLVLLGRLDEARDLLQRVETLVPSNPLVHRNLGLLHYYGHDYEDAEKAFRRTLRLEAGFVSALHNLGNVLEATARFDEAIEIYDRALRHAPKDPEMRFDRGLCYLRARDYERGFADYEARLNRRDQRARHQRFKPPLWDGGDFAGKTLIVYGEQGFGDIIQCARYLPGIKERGGTIIFYAPQQIKRLLETVAGVDRVVTPDEEMPAADLKVPVFSLPGLFETRWPDIPAKVPYVSAAPRDTSPLDGDGLKVGLVWAGSKIFKGDYTRSMRLEYLAPLLDVPGVSYFNLQFGESTAGFDDRIHDLGDETLGDFYQTGGIIEQLDLLISVDTVTVHLAGALDRPVWAMLAYACDWRWGADGDRSPWYPSVRLYRQPEPKQWDAVVARIADDLTALATERATS